MYNISFKVKTDKLISLTLVDDCEIKDDKTGVIYESKELHIGTECRAVDIISKLFCDINFNYLYFDDINDVYSTFKQMIYFVKSDFKEERQFSWYSSYRGIDDYIIFKINKF